MSTQSYTPKEQAKRTLASNLAFLWVGVLYIVFGALAYHVYLEGEHRTAERASDQAALVARDENSERQIDAMKTELVRQQAQLAKDQERIQRLIKRNSLVNSLIEQSGTAFVAIDSNRKVALWNSGAESMFGWKRDEMIGQPLDRLMWPDKAAKHNAGLDVALQSTNTRDVQIVLCDCRTKDQKGFKGYVRAQFVVEEGERYAVATINYYSQVKLHGFDESAK